MAVQVRMPALGESVTEGTVTRWLKKEGESVEEGEALLEVSTDKVDTEIPSPVGGVVTSILVGEDETVAVGGELAVVDDAVAAASIDTADPVPSAASAATAPYSPGPDGEHFATPAVVAFAREHGVALAGVVGSGPAGRIRRQDVHSAARLTAWQPAPGPQPGSGPAAPTRPVVAAAPASRPVATPALNGRVPVTAAGRTVLRELDVTKVEALRLRSGARFAAREGAELTFAAFVAKAAVDGLRAAPALNAGAGAVNLAMESGGGSTRTVVQDAGGLNLTGIARRTAASADSASTFTVTVSDHGDLVDLPALAPGHSGALGVGTIVKQPRIVPGADGGDTIAARSVCTVALTYDDGQVSRADARSFLAAFADRLVGARFDVLQGV